MKRKTRSSQQQLNQTIDKDKIIKEKEFEELKQKIINFRVADLQTILGSQNCNKNGRKDELQKRILDLFKSSSDHTKLKIKSKIEEILTGFRPAATMYHGYGDQVRNPMAHANGIGISPFAMHNLPVQPDVKLKKLAFYDILGTLIQPTTLMPTNNTQRVQDGTYTLHLTPQQATDIAMNRDVRNPAKMEHIIQVQLRFCLLETSCEQEDYFPPNVVVKVNGKPCQLPNPIPTNKPGVDPKRPPRPVNITPHIKLSPTVSNVIHVQWGTEYNRGFVISCYLVRKLTSSQLLQRMKTKGIKPAEYTRGLIKEKFNEDADCEIATTLLKVSLICPLGKMRMSTPCRASTCSHLQCFDASLYLQMNERKPTWNCPVCDKAALYENLVIDGYFQEVVMSNSLSSDDNEIQLHKDGSWSTLINKQDMCSLDTPMKSQKVEVISDDIEVITDDIPKPFIKAQPTSYPSNNGSASNGNSVASDPPPATGSGDTVDLTLSDSDEDMPLKKVPCTRSTQNSKSKTNDTIINLDDSPSPPSRSPFRHPSLSSNFDNVLNSFQQYDLSVDPFENTSLSNIMNPSNMNLPNVNVVHPYNENSNAKR